MTRIRMPAIRAITGPTESVMVMGDASFGLVSRYTRERPPWFRRSRNSSSGGASGGSGAARQALAKEADSAAGAVDLGLAGRKAHAYEAGGLATKCRAIHH